MTASIESVTNELSAIERELARRRLLLDPVKWHEEKLKGSLWSGQKAILRAIRDNRKVACMTCHAIGKSYSAATITGWWLDTHKSGDAFVITTAPTQPQVKIILWKEIGRVHSKGQLKGRLNQTEWIMDVNGKEETVALGRKPNDYSPTAFQGIHAPNVLVIVDEANGVRGNLWDAIDSMIANDGSKMLAIGNPDDPSGEFFDACKPNSGWHVVQVSAFESPNFTGEHLPKNVLGQLVGYNYVEEKRKKWAPTWRWTPDNRKVVPPEDGKLEDTHPFWQSKVLGQFPVQAGEGSLIPLSWIRAAQQRNLKPGTPNEFALDVGASEDGDPSCLGWRRGSVFRVLYEERQPDTMKTLGRMLQYLHNIRYGASCVKVDYIGVGRGVVDRANENREPVIPISVSSTAANPREFANLLSELWWNVRTLFELGEIDIDEEDEELAEELLKVRWAPNSRGQTVISYCDGPSPNRADALMLAFAPTGEAFLPGTPIGLERESKFFRADIIDTEGTARSRWKV